MFPSRFLLLLWACLLSAPANAQGNLLPENIMAIQEALLFLRPFVCGSPDVQGGQGLRWEGWRVRSLCVLVEQYSSLRG